jgi:hypothetical protein
MKYLDCLLKYIGQTERKFHARYEKHIQGISNNNGNSGYRNNTLNTEHTFGTTTDTMDIIQR